MSGYVVADNGAPVMQNVGTNVEYMIAEDQFGFKNLLAKPVPDIVLAPILTRRVLNHNLFKRFAVY